MKVSSTILIREIDGSDYRCRDGDQQLEVRSHDESSNWVVLVVDGKSFAVSGDELVRAINNAKNANEG